MPNPNAISEQSPFPTLSGTQATEAAAIGSVQGSVSEITLEVLRGDVKQSGIENRTLDVVIDQENDTRVYMKVYRDSKNTTHQIVIEVDKNNNAVVVTTFTEEDSGLKSNRALNYLKGQIRKAKNIVYSLFD